MKRKKIPAKKIQKAAAQKQKIKLAVLMGGPSGEHEVSLLSGRQVTENLDDKKYEVLPVLIDRRGLWLIGNGDSQPLPEPEALLTLTRAGVRVAFIAMHGEYGEDGTVQRLLKAAEISFTGSGALSSALAMHKPLASRVMKEYGLNVPDFLEVHYLDWNKRLGEITKEADKKLGFPMIVKPARSGSSVGLTFVGDSGDLRFTPLKSAVDHALSYGRDVIIQKFVSGREATCAVLEKNGEATALEPTEIIPAKSGLFDYRAKYSDGGAQEITPPKNIGRADQREIQKITLTAHKLLGCSGLSRTDVIVGHDKKIYVLETNTIPGLTAQSLLPKAALASGIKFPKLLDIIIESAAV